MLYVPLYLANLSCKGELNVEVPLLNVKKNECELLLSQDDNNPRTGFEADAVHPSVCLLPAEQLRAQPSQSGGRFLVNSNNNHRGLNAANNMKKECFSGDLRV